MTPNQLHTRIAAFIKKWKNPPGTDDPKSLEMLYDFAHISNSKIHFHIVPKGKKT